MKITLFIDSLEFSGGTEKVTTMIANGLSECGHKVDIITLSNYSKSYFDLSSDISVRSINISGGWVKRIIHRFIFMNKLALGRKSDVFIVVDTMLFLYFLPSSIFLKNIICWEHFIFSEDLGNKFRKLARMLSILLAKKIVTLTERDKKFWVNAGSKNSKVLVIPNPSSFMNLIREDDINESKIVLSVGRLEHVKGFDRLIKAWSLIAKKNSEWKLKIVGSGSEEDNLKSLVRKYEIEKFVIFVPATRDVEQHFKSASIYCLSSRFEGFGMVLVEALSHSLPIVSFDCEAGPREILNNTCSIICPDGNIEKLATSLQSLITDDNQRAKLASGSYQRAKIYNLQNVIRMWNDLLHDVKDKA